MKLDGGEGVDGLNAGFAGGSDRIVGGYSDPRPDRYGVGMSWLINVNGVIRIIELLPELMGDDVDCATFAEEFNPESVVLVRSS